MRLLSVSDIETIDGEYCVELFDISVYVSVYKRRGRSQHMHGLSAKATLRLEALCRCYQGANQAFRARFVNPREPRRV